MVVLPKLDEGDAFMALGDGGNGLKRDVLAEAGEGIVKLLEGSKHPAGAAREDDEDSDSENNPDGADRGGQASHGSAEVSLVLPERLWADLLARQWKRGGGLIGFYL